MAAAIYNRTEKQHNLFNWLFRLYTLHMKFLKPGGRDTHTDFPDKSNFKKPGVHLVK